jgi:hypothetical protein
MARWEKHGTTSNLTLSFLHYFASVFHFFGGFIYQLKSLVEVVEYRIWLKKNFGKIPLYSNKKKLIDRVLEEVNHSTFAPGGITFFEFGVAFGETTKYIVQNLEGPYQYHGFDTFEGLPKAWRRLPKGAITNYGKLPAIKSENLFFHKGLVQETIQNVDFKVENRKCFIFDFDLYAPTLFAFRYIQKEIKVSDIVYFDEAFDSDERVIIENYFLDEFEYSVIGASPFGLAFKIMGFKV